MAGEKKEEAKLAGSRSGFPSYGVSFHFAPGWGERQSPQTHRAHCLHPCSHPLPTPQGLVGTELESPGKIVAGMPFPGRQESPALRPGLSMGISNTAPPPSLLWGQNWGGQKGTNIQQTHM